MDSEYIVITELLTVIAVVVVIAWVMIRDKKQEIGLLKTLNEDLMTQIESLEQFVEEHKQQEKGIEESFREVENSFNKGIDGYINQAQEALSDMDRLSGEHRNSIKNILDLVSAGEEFDDPVDVPTLKSKLTELDREIVKLKRKIKLQISELAKAKKESLVLKSKIRELSKRLLSIGALEIREKRLKREKDRLKDKLDKMRQQFEKQKVLTKDLEGELKTSFRSGEVQSLKDELRKSEDELKRTLTEKLFIERHFVSLDEMRKEGEEAIQALDRAKREIKTLENSVIEQDQESKSPPSTGS